MAAKKKVAKKKAATTGSEYIVLYSDCGGDEQLTALNDYDTKIHKTEAAAIKEAEQDISDTIDGVVTGAYVIAKIVKRGKSAGLVWK